MIADADTMRSGQGKGTGRSAKLTRIIDRVKNPQDFDKERRLAEEMIDRGRYSDALSIYSELLQLRPSDPHLLALRGYASYRIGNAAAALNDFDAALALKPDAPNTLFLRAKCKESLSDLDGAIADYNNVIALAPQTADAYSSIAMIYEYRGDLAAARREYKKAIAIDPSLKSAARFFQRKNPGQ